MNLETKIQKNQATRYRMAVVFGALAGVAFAGVAWGIDAYRLAQSNAILPYLDFGLGLVPCLVTGALAGLLSYRFNNVFLALLLWVVTGWVFARVGGHVAFQMRTAALGLLAPGIAAQVSYPFTAAAGAYQGIITFATVGIGLLAGFLAITLIENAVEASAPIARAIPFLIWIALFAVAGLSVQDNLTNRFTAPVAGADRLVQFALEHEGQTVDAGLAASMHLRALEPIQDLLHRPRRLILAGYDEAYTNMTVLIDFDGVPVRCSVLGESVNYCER